MWSSLHVVKIRSLGTDIPNHLWEAQAVGCLVQHHKQAVSKWTDLKDLYFNDNVVIFYFEVATLCSLSLINCKLLIGVVSSFIANTVLLVTCIFISVFIILWTGSSVPCGPVHAQSDWSSWQRLSPSPKATSIQAVSSGGMQWKS